MDVKFLDGSDSVQIFRSTPKNRPNKMGQMSVLLYVSPFVHPSAKSFSDSDEIWYVGRGR